MKSELQGLIDKDCGEILQGGAEQLSALKGETILVTGGTGFTGTWLAEFVARLNDDYRFGSKLVLLSKNTQAFEQKAPHLAKRADIKLVSKDIVDLAELDQDITFIIHAAASPDSRVHSSDPVRTMNTIARGTEALLSAASRLPNPKKILNISSGLIYGGQPLELERIPESFHGGPDCDSIVSVYPESKRYAETLCAAYRSLFKLPIITARPFAFIGPYQLLDKPWAINNFINDAVRGSSIRILGDEQTVRSYMYPSDMAFWLLRMLAAGKPGHAYNIGSPDGITLRELAEKIAGFFPVPLKVVADGLVAPKTQRSRFVPDTSLAAAELGLGQKVGIDEAIRRSITWYKKLNG
jgi:dTDP-glucose 4,6-dehydratase